MSFISYSQNFEDVVLWRALGQVANGFYIDVGAWSPNLHSITRAFYQHGWCGINIEPNAEYHQQLQQHRPRDCNLQLAVGAQAGFETMHIVADTGLSTLDETIAQQHQQAGWSLECRQVQVCTIEAIWCEHVPAAQPVHFLSVDVEGLETAVLRGLDWQRHRPWVVLVEATWPNSQIESHQAWEPILLAAGYRFAYADGLNRFYVAAEHAQLLSAFKHPPNVFDAFVPARLHEAQSRAEQADATAAAAQSRAEQADSAAAAAQSRAAAAELLAAQLLSSRSWRITAPLRKIGHLFKP